MPEQFKPEIPKPEAVKQLKTGEQHVALGCLFMVGGLVALGVVLYLFRDFFLEYPIWTVIGILVISSIYTQIMYKWKGK